MPGDEVTPLVRERIRVALETQGLMQLLGAVVHEIGTGSCVLGLPYHPRVTQQNGLFHGGAIAFLVDNATTAAAATVLGLEHTVITADYTLHLLAPALGDALICRARVVKRGRRITVAAADVFVRAGDQERHVATALASIANLPVEAEPRASAMGSAASSAAADPPRQPP